MVVRLCWLRGAGFCCHGVVRLRFVGLRLVGLRLVGLDAALNRGWAVCLAATAASATLLTIVSIFVTLGITLVVAARAAAVLAAPVLGLQHRRSSRHFCLDRSQQLIVVIVVVQRCLLRLQRQ
jgi:hypothetical protein